VQTPKDSNQDSFRNPDVQNTDESLGLLKFFRTAVWRPESPFQAPQNDRLKSKHGSSGKYTRSNRDESLRTPEIFMTVVQEADPPFRIPQGLATKLKAAIVSR
jgi:hypothetical protein